MENLHVAEVLEEIADMLEMKGVDFKPRAYRNAAQTVRSLSSDVTRMSKEEMKGLPGIGESISKKIKELAETGHLEYYEKLKEEFPLDFKALMSVEGLGPKTIRRLHDELGVSNLDDLEKAAKEHKIRELEGFGEKSERSILENLQYARESTGRKLLGFILPTGKGIQEQLAGLDHVERVEIAGSVRRRRATIGDFDFLVVTDKPTGVMDFFVSLDSVDKVIAKGEAKSTVRLEEGMDADVRVIDAKSFGAALMYFTGSKDHNIAVRKVAIDRGYKLNEYGLFRGKESVAGRTEEEIYKKLGMEFIPPELRENRGEVEAAMEGRLPDLLGYDALKGDLQMHTKASDGKYTAREMAERARELGHEYVAVTDHVGSLKVAGGMEPEELEEQAKEIEQLNDELQDITVLHGAEVNIMSDGSLDFPDSALEQLDVVVASIHSGFSQTTEKLTERILSAMSNDHVNIIAHPTGRELGKRKGYDLQWDKVFDASRDTGTFLEINSHPARLDLTDTKVRAATDAGCRLVINTDAHNIDHLPYIELGIATARRGWAEAKDIINTRPLKELRKLLQF